MLLALESGRDANVDNMLEQEISTAPTHTKQTRVDQVLVPGVTCDMLPREQACCS